MDLREEPAISNWKRPCFPRLSGSEFPEPTGSNPRFQAGKWRSDPRLRDRLSRLRNAESGRIQRCVVSQPLAGDRLGWQPAIVTLNLPSPKQAKTHAMPTHNRLRLDDD